MKFSYRTRRFFYGLAITLLILLLAAALGLLCWLLWLHRYVVYTRDGAKLDFSSTVHFQGEVAAAPTGAALDIDIYYNEGGGALVSDDASLQRFSGLYITTDMMTEDFDAVLAAAKSVTGGSTVMVDVKNIRGEFYYDTSLGRTSSSVTPTQMAELLGVLQASGCYLIARFPALRDYWYGLEHVDDGIFNPNRLSLWMDEQRCYWLNPSADGTLSYLVQIIGELKALGFHEVALTDFKVPDTENIYFEGDRDAAINKLADSLVRVCASSSFAVSFFNSSASFTLPEGRSRLYLEDVAAADAAAKAEASGIDDQAARIVFLTDLMDTRFEVYCVLRPLPLS